MKKNKNPSSSYTGVAVLAVMAVGLVLTSVAASAHAQANSATKNMTSAAKSMASESGNKTKTSEAANSTMSNATQAGSGNQSASNSTNPLAKVPIIGKLFGGK